MPPTLARVGEQASVQCIVEGGSPRPAVRLFITIIIIDIIIIFTIVIIRQTVRLLTIMIIMVQNEDPTISASHQQACISQSGRTLPRRARLGGRSFYKILHHDYQDHEKPHCLSDNGNCKVSDNINDN